MGQPMSRSTPDKGITLEIAKRVSDIEFVDIPLRIAMGQRDREARPVDPCQLIHHFRCRFPV